MEVKLDKEKILIGITIFLLVMLVGGFGYIQSIKNQPNLSVSPDDNQEINNKDRIEELEYIFVHVSGNVKNTGVYKLPKGARVHQAIDLAGGPTEEGDLDKLNLAQIIQDGQKITVPSINDEQSYVDEYQSNSSGKININTATKETLETLIGIGPAKANAIIDYRLKNGSFDTIEDIQKVAGIGPATFNQIKDQIIVN